MSDGVFGFISDALTLPFRAVFAAGPQQAAEYAQKKLIDEPAEEAEKKAKKLADEQRAAQNKLIEDEKKRIEQQGITEAAQERFAADKLAKRMKGARGARASTILTSPLGEVGDGVPTIGKTLLGS